MNPSKIKLLLIVLIIIVLGIGGYIYWNQSQWKTYSNEELNISFKYPAQLIASTYGEDGKQGRIASFLIEGESNFFTLAYATSSKALFSNIPIASSTPNTLADMVSYFKHSTSTIPQLSKDGVWTNIVVDGKPGFKLIAGKNTAVFVENNGVYSLAFSTASDKNAELGKYIEKIINSVEFR